MFLRRLTDKMTACLLMAFFLVPGVAFSGDKLPVGTWKTAQTIQPFFYQRFLPEKYHAEVFSFTNPADQKTALLAGSLVMTGTTLAHAIHSASLGQPIVIVSALCNKCSALVVKKDGPIHSAKDLKGKTIGYVPGTMHEILLRETLVRNGLSPEKDVTLVRVDFFDMGTALATGSIDAFLSGEPFPTLAVSKGYGRILSYPYYGESIGTINAGMIIKRSTLEQQPELVAELVLAHAKASAYLTSHQEEWLTKAAEFGTPLDILTSAAANMELSWDMDETFVRQAKALGERMQELGIISRQPDYESLFDLSFVRQAREKLN
ncbi:MAG: ABC transporter substrate-binding protein [Desulfuromonadales bacterium]|nr:ABC transporter substrate-binding protein [Desulfuromonadales bacterium]MBN2791612.1 ABC transporter substrate-binding protein [Desulfuromonadales bacterium]